MDNTTIAEEFSLLSKVMDIHGENSFKTRSYSIAAFQIEQLGRPLSAMTEEEIFRVKGIGAAIGKKILVMLETGHFPLLEQYLEETPSGILEMLHIKGLGPKKIAVIWKELGIENIGELLYACNENRLMLYKGFGAKTQENIRRSIEFLLASKGQYLYEALEDHAASLVSYWETALGGSVQVTLTGDIRRQCNTLNKVSLFINSTAAEIRSHIPAGSDLLEIKDNRLLIKDVKGIETEIFSCPGGNAAFRLFETTGSEGFVKDFLTRFPGIAGRSYASEDAIFEAAGIPAIPPCLREDAFDFNRVKENGIPDLIRPTDIRGIIHAHSTWSDGKNTLEEMAAAARDRGFEYLVISDHSQSAVYAKGLKPDRVLAQHAQVDELNEKLSPFRIFKSIESDILYDGSLDYPDELLRTFDLVIASVHSNLKMDEQKAMQRLLRAIENPFTTILGHPTGRLLLSRPGYPVDHKKLIDACAANGVAIEINAHPRRLDMDWSWIPYALEKNVLLSIDPDAHDTGGMDHVRFGVLSARKGGLTARGNLSSFPLKTFEALLRGKK